LSAKILQAQDTLKEVLAQLELGGVEATGTRRKIDRLVTKLILDSTRIRRASDSSGQSSYLSSSSGNSSRVVIDDQSNPSWLEHDQDMQEGAAGHFSLPTIPKRPGPNRHSAVVRRRPSMPEASRPVRRTTLSPLGSSTPILARPHDVRHAVPAPRLDQSTECEDTEQIDKEFNKSLLNLPPHADVSAEEREHTALENVTNYRLAPERWSVRPTDMEVQMLLRNDDYKLEIRKYVLAIIRERHHVTSTGVQGICREIAEKILGPEDDRVEALAKYLDSSARRKSSDLGGVMQKIIDIHGKYCQCIQGGLLPGAGAP